MNISDKINILVDLASQIEFSQHQYIEKKSDTYVLTQNKTDRSHLVDLINEINGSTSNLSPIQLKQFNIAVQMIEDHLNKKITGIFSWFIGKEDKARIRTLIDTIRSTREQSIPALPVSESQSEGEARLKFYAELPRRLRVKDAAGNDLKVIKEVSSKIWDAYQNDAKYKEHMTIFFEGEHILFEEENDSSGNFEFYDKLKNPDMHSYLRGSSHYDHGTTNGKTGGPVPTQDEIERKVVLNPQYEIEGPQVKALLFGRVKLALGKDSKPILGKTFEQVREEAQKKREAEPNDSRKYTFLQTEWAPDSHSFFTANYWKHRIFSFCLYAGRKILGLEKPNVGPYGFGHADTKSTIIPLRKP